MVIEVQTIERFVVGNKVVDLRIAREGYKCEECGQPIEPSIYHYRVTDNSPRAKNNEPVHVHLGCAVEHLWEANSLVKHENQN